MRKRKVKPFVRYVRLDYGDNIQPLAEVLNELGYDVFESPVNDEGVFVSNFPLTESWVFKNAKRFDLKLRGWRPSLVDEELSLATY